MTHLQSDHDSLVALQNLNRTGLILNLILLVLAVGVLALGPIYFFYVVPAAQADRLLDLSPRDAAMDRGQFSGEIQEHIRSNTRGLPVVYSFSLLMVVILSGTGLVVATLAHARLKKSLGSISV